MAVGEAEAAECVEGAEGEGVQGEVVEIKGQAWRTMAKLEKSPVRRLMAKLERAPVRRAMALHLTVHCVDHRLPVEREV